MIKNILSSPIVTEVPLQDRFFPSILNGRKNIDSRINKPPYDTLSQGSIIKFVGTQTKTLEAYCRIEDRRNYKTFREMLTSEGLSNCLPIITNIDEGVRTYLGFPNYAAHEKIYGVVAFKIVPIQYKA